MAYSSDKQFVVIGDFCPIGEAIRSLAPTLRPLAGPGANGLLPVIANLECPLTRRDGGLPFKWANLKADPETAPVLEGLDVAVLANNHISDFGAEGARETIALLEKRGIKPVGYGRDMATALGPVFLDLKGARLGVVALNCPTTNGENLATHSTEGVAPLGMGNLADAVQSAKIRCDALLVHLHWGCEWVHDPVPDQLRLARHAINCGADAVVGCHSHTIQSCEQHRGRWIFYGLGNFLFGQGEAQSVQPDGSVVRQPLRLDAPNRESLAVSFSIQPDTGEGRLRLEKIQPMSFGDDWVPKPIQEHALSFNFKEANDRLRDYVRDRQAELEQPDEPAFVTKFRNGVLAYWYQAEPIGSAARKENSRGLLGPLAKLARFGR